MTVENINSKENNELEQFNGELDELVKDIRNEKKEYTDDATMLRVYSKLNSLLDKEHLEFTPEDIKVIQTALKIEGYYEKGIDGVYGARTAKAVKDFQVKNNLMKVDGRLGGETVQKLKENIHERLITSAR